MAHPIRTGVARLAVLLLLGAVPGVGYAGAPAQAEARAPHSDSALADSIRPGQLIQPAELARTLADSTAPHPALLHVGFQVLFRSGHIPGSRYIGQASKPEGLVALKLALRRIPRGQSVVLYCGCCPWTDCPNVRPALLAAREIGARNVRVLYIARNLERDWVERGFPIVQGDR